MNTTTNPSLASIGATPVGRHHLFEFFKSRKIRNIDLAALCDSDVSTVGLVMSGNRRPAHRLEIALANLKGRIEAAERREAAALAEENHELVEA